MFFVFEREEKRQEKNDNWNFWIWVFLSKNGRFVTHNFFPKKIGWNPYFYSVFGCTFSGPRCQKKAIFGYPVKKKKILTDNWKALFWYFSVFSFSFFVLFFLGFFCVVFCFVFFFCFFVFCFFGGFKGQVRWPKGPPHLALNPPYFFVFVFLLFFVFFLEGLRVRWGGPKGHLTWP